MSRDCIIDFRAPHINVQWKNIQLYTNDGKAILKGVSGCANSGELTAIIGPSGAGKSTLLNVLSGFRNRDLRGNILVNGAEREMSAYRTMSCYIMQDYLLFPYLTVRETTHLAACLKTTTALSSRDRVRMVDQCIESLGLTGRQNNQAGKLSGGEKKRLCIAQELVSNPPLIYLDEPTSGLDSSSCLQCIKLLKMLANEGRTVVCAIHQPSAKLFEIFDKLYILAEGQCIYRGATKDLISFLAAQGLSCPQYHNPADFAIEVAVGEHGDWIWRLKTAVDCLADNDSRWPSLSSKLENDFKNSYSGSAASSWNTFKVLTYRNIICKMRDPMVTQLRLLAHVAVGILIGLLYFDIGNDASKILNNSAFLFFSVLFLIFTAMMPTVLTFPMEKTILSREYTNNWYSIKMYYLSKTVSEIPFQILFPVIYCSIVYWMTSQPNDVVRFGLFLVSCVMVSFVAQSVGLLIGAATNVQTAVFLAPAASIPFLLFSGFFITLNSIPSYLRWISYVSYVRYGFQSLLLGIYSMDRAELRCDQMFCPFKDPEVFLRQMDMTDGNLYVDFAAQLLFFFILKFAAYHVLYYKTVYKQ